MENLEKNISAFSSDVFYSILVFQNKAKTNHINLIKYPGGNHINLIKYPGGNHINLIKYPGGNHINLIKYPDGIALNERGLYLLRAFHTMKIPSIGARMPGQKM